MATTSSSPATAAPLRIETKFRRIRTPIPVPEAQLILDELNRYESRAMHGQLPVVWDRAEGFQVHDAWGNTWIDFTSTIFVANAGHANPRVVEAVREQLAKPLLHAYNYATEIRAEYLHYLIEVTPASFEKAFLLSAGTEATECALKLMRLQGHKVGKRRPGIIAFEGNWHGRTVGAQMMSFNPGQKAWTGYSDPNIHHLPFPYPWRVEALLDPGSYFERSIAALLEEKKLDPDQDLCGFMLETFQGWGALFYPEGFVRAVREFADRHDMLVAFDEMQAGFGRTGRLFGYLHYGVGADLLCCGKGVSSGLPLSLVLGSREVMDLPDIGSMSSTHSANPLACAAGLANLKALLEDGLIENASVLGETLQRRLEDMQGRFPAYIAHVFAKGLLAALHLRDTPGRSGADLATQISEEAMRHGLLVVHTGRESIKLAPPLVITEEALEEGLQVLEEAIEAIVGSKGSS